MPKGRPRKPIQRNISGLRNQKRLRSPSPSALGQGLGSLDLDPGARALPTRNPRKRRHDDHLASESESNSDADWDPQLSAGGDCTNAHGDEFDEQEVTEDDAGWGGDLEDDIFFEKMSRLGVELDMDDDWVPHRLRWREELRKIKKCE
jgi:hypothetical protein